MSLPSDFKVGRFDCSRRVTSKSRWSAVCAKIGYAVLDVDPDTGRQCEVRDQTGHGSMDGIVKGEPLPPNGTLANSGRLTQQLPQKATARRCGEVKAGTL